LMIFSVEKLSTANSIQLNIQAVTRCSFGLSRFRLSI